MPSLGWMFNRLRLMGPGEVAWRSRKALLGRLERARAALAPTATPAPQERWGKTWVDGTDSVGAFDARVYRAAADRVLAGRYDLFALKDLELGFPPRWNRDPKTGVEAPLVFGKTLDYRDERVAGDIKYLWEINRHYELVTLAQAWHLCGEDAYAFACRTMLDSWFRECPYPLGANWASALEHAVRLVNWSVAWDLLGAADSALFDGAEGTAFRNRWLGAIYRHCDFIAHHLSRYSSANNHLFGEYMGMLVASLTWPCWSQSAGWRDMARRGLETEALKQNGEDGVNLEQAIWYQHEVADMMLLCGLCARRNELEFSRAYWSRLEAMLDYIAMTMDVAGNVPMIGDSDDAVMVRFDPAPGFNVYRSLLATGAILFRRSDFKLKAVAMDDKSRWLTGASGAAVFDAMQAGRGKPGRRTFPHGGYYVLGSDLDTTEEVRIVADAGPLGYLSIAAHGHADALSFTLSAGGRELLVDPGTCAYHTQPVWRAYFRGTAAHNTVRVDGVDQSEPGGNFMWLRKAHAMCELWDTDEEADRFAARHEGYGRLSDPVVHKRKLLYLKRKRLLVVEDILECRGQHEVESWWHFAEDCQLQVHEQGTVDVTCGHVRLRMERRDGVAVPELFLGAEQPPAGWISRRFDRRDPSPSLVWKEHIAGNYSCITTIGVHFTNI
jgi:hypothetical protein